MMSRGRSSRTVLVAVALAAARALLATGAQARGRLPRLLAWDGHGFAVRSATIYYSGVIGRLPSAYRAVGKRPGGLRWKVWNGARAVGFGTVWIKSCVPDCAGSPFDSRRLTITATRVRYGEFTRMTLSYLYGGKPVIDRRCVIGVGARAGWAICGTA